MKVTKKLDLSQRYSFPSEIQTIRYDGRIIIIAPSCLTWIVLDNEAQLHFFNLLKSLSISEAISSQNFSEEDIRNTLTQIEARGFSGHPAARIDSRENTTHMQFFLTDGCNLRCPHCLMNATRKSDNELTTAEVCATLEAFKNNGGEVVTFSGGEIGLRDDLLEIVSYCSTIGLKADLLTNGTLWTEDIVRQISKSLGRVQVSIDGFSEESNARIRGKGNFEKSLHAVDVFVRAGVKVEVAVTPMLTDALESEIPFYIAWADSLKKKYEGCDFNFHFTAELVDGRNVKLTAEQQERFGRIMTSINNGYFGEDSEAEAFISYVKAGDRKDGCAFGSFNVRANGDVYTCGRVASLKPVANIRRDDLQTVFQNLRRLTLLSCVDNLSPCKLCALRYFCGGECRIKYFDSFAMLDDIKHLPEKERLTRKCDPSFKEHFYKLMIETNTRLWS